MPFDWNDKISKKVSNIKPSGIRRFFDIAASKPDVISLGVGEPDFITPYNIREAAIKSLQKGYTQYTSNRGLIELREKISEYMLQRIGVSYSPNEEIILTAGASEAIDIALRAIINEGDEILLPEPCYVSYAPCITLAGGVPKVIKTDLENKFKLRKGELERVIGKRTKALILPYPNNPTGAIMTEQDLVEIAPILRESGIVVISDEIYAELTYGRRHKSIASMDGLREQTIIINGFSKAFAMTGWRLGFLAADSTIVDAALKIHQYAIMCAPTVSQYAALAALTEGMEDNYSDVLEMKDEYDKRRRLMLHSFNEMGLNCFEPEGAFYCFPDVSSTGMDGSEFAARLIEQKNVAVIPGEAFGEFGKNFVRCCYATGIKSIEEAMKRIAEFVKALNRR